MIEVKDKFIFYLDLLIMIFIYYLKSDASIKYCNIYIAPHKPQDD